MDIDRKIHPTPLLATPNGAAYPLGPDRRYLVGFLGTWMSLHPGQLEGLGNALGRMLQCTCHDRCLEEGLLLRTPDGDHRMRLEREAVLEFHGLVNDLLLLADAQVLAAEIFAS